MRAVALFFVVLAQLSLSSCSPEAPDKARYGQLLGRTPRAADATVREAPPTIEQTLRAIADALPTHPYLGSVRRDALRARLESLPPNAPPYVRVRLLVPLGLSELEQGDAQRAVALLEEARRLTPPEVQMAASVEMHTAIAWMRLAELRNCIARHTSESCIAPIRGAGQHIFPRGSEAALAGYRRVIAHPASPEPVKLTARWLLNISSMALGRWPDGVEPELRIPLEAYGAEPFERFTNIAGEIGLNRLSHAGGAVADDFDGDGDLDVVTSSWDVTARLYYYRNNGDGSFTERGVAAGLSEQLGGLNIEHADYDGDGRLDLLVLRGAWLGPEGEHPNSLLRNVGGGRFVDVTQKVGLAGAHHPTQAAAFGDYDNDGDLDLYVANESVDGDVRHSQLFRNDGATFTDVASAAGVTNGGFAKAAAWGDYDEDDDLDLFVANLEGANRLYRNNGDGTFTDVAETAGVTAPKDAFPAWWWDFDNDGHLDLMSWHGFVQSPGSRPVPPVWVVAADRLGLPHDGQHPRLYKGDGRGGFTDVTARVGLDRVFLVMGSNLGDLDNDGWLDAYLGTGYPGYDGLMPNVALHNLAGARFADVSATSGLSHLQKGHGVAFADFDHDGDQDVFAEMGGAFAGDAFMDAMFENPGFGHAWIVVEAVGTKSNRSAFGARIRVDVTEDGKPRSIYRVVDNGGSFGGNPLRQHIGLGAAEKVDALEIYWPATKIRQRFAGLTVNQSIRVVEGAKAFERRPYIHAPFKREAGHAHPPHHHPK